jgi:hypothetical protein
VITTAGRVEISNGRRASCGTPTSAGSALVPEIKAVISFPLRQHKQREDRNGRSTRTRAKTKRAGESYHRPPRAVRLRANAPDEKHTERSPTTSTGLLVEDQVRRNGILARAAFPLFDDNHRLTSNTGQMAYARYDTLPKPLATSQATAGSRCGNERPRRRRDRHHRLRDNGLLVRESNSPGRASPSVAIIAAI